MVTASIVLRLLTVCWAVVLLWRLRAWRAWFWGALSLFIATFATASLQPSSVLLWLQTPPSEATPTVLLVALTRLFVVILAERALAGRKEAEINLEARTRLQRQLVEDSLGLMCAHDLDGVLLSINPAAASALGIRPEDGVGRNVKEFLSPSIQNEFDGYLDRVRRNRADSGLLQMKTTDGKQRIWSYRNVLYEERGASPRVLGYAQDVTDLRAAKRALWKGKEELDKRVQERTRELTEAKAALEQEVAERKQSETALRLTQFSVDRAADAVFWVNQNGEISNANETACRTLGYSPEELTSLSVHDVDHLYPKGAWPGVWDRIKHDGIVRLESGHKTQEGKIIPVDIVINYLEFDGREYACAIVRDITARKATEESLRKSEEQLRLITDALPVCIGYTDSEQRYQFNNKAYEEWFGVSRSEFRGRHVKEVLGASTYEAIRGYVQQALAGRPVSFETTLLLGGQERHVLANYIPHVGQQGETQGYFALIRDITQLKQAEEERKKLEAAVQRSQKLESLGVMAGGIAHDFNNLLMGVLGNAEIALMELPLESPAREELRGISTAAQRAADLTKQLLAYSGKGTLVMQPLDLSKLVKEMAHLLEVSIPKSVRLKYSFAENVPTIEGDATQIRQIVMNLILNASEAIGEQDGVVTTSTGVSQADSAFLSESSLGEGLPAGRYAYLEVADTGCGMDEETKGKIFDPFFTTKFTGRGLGLAAALGIVRGHRGALRVSSQPLRGSTFQILLPCSERAAAAARKSSGALEAWRGGGTVLVVDDEETVRTMAKKVLQRGGFVVLTAKDGQEALEVFRNRADEILVVLLDLTMPRLNGEETLQELRRIRPDVKTILSSGYDEQEVANRFAGKGLAGFVQKPYRPRELIRAVRQIVDSAD